MIAVVVILVFIIITLIIYNMSIHDKITKFQNINQKITSINVLQDFMNTIGEDASPNEKLRKINEILIEKYDIKYSTIVVFDGTDYILRASNVDEKHYAVLRNLHQEEIFRDSIETTIPKYLTVNSEAERLPYQKMEFGRAKSAMFFPLYFDNVYIGYWIIESGVPHAFDNIDTSILEIVRENIVSVLKSVAYQNTMENIVRKDKYSGLYSAEYLYGRGKKTINRYTISTICMFKIINLEEINDKISRKLGNKTITTISRLIKENISSEYIFVRYMGPKFVIAFSGVETNAVVDFLEDMKRKIETQLISLEPMKQEEENVKKKAIKKIKKECSPKLNFVISSYYKGTALEEVTKKLESYLDNADTKESEINSI